jgi:GNAT superfamily N-acetyltransferase
MAIYNAHLYRHCINNRLSGNDRSCKNTTIGAIRAVLSSDRQMNPLVINELTDPGKKAFFFCESQYAEVSRMSSFTSVTGYVPGVIGRVAELHARYYSEHWGFQAYFEAKVATELSGFISRYNADKDGIFSLIVDGAVEGSLSIDGTSESDNMAHLRWFIVSDKLRGQGAGNFLMEQAMTFCKQKDYRGVYLWTFKGLQSARHLYEKYGFSLTEESTGDQWGSVVTEQRFDVDLTAT